MKKIYATTLLSLVLLGACKKDNESNPTANTDASKRALALQDYQDNYVGSEAATNEIGWTGSTDNCDAGTTTDSYKNKVLKRVNYFRRVAGLPDDITLNSDKNAKAQKAALMFNANNQLSHTPPDTWTCYTEDGKTAAGKSNIGLGLTGPKAITAYMNDNGVASLGHRRWVIYSKLKEVGTGDTPRSNALWVIGDTKSTVENMPEFIAWPAANYIPKSLVFGKWSFGIPGASFSEATVSMTGPEGTVQLVTDTNLGNGYGDNTMAWTPDGINKTSTEDVSYTVNVKNVKLSDGTFKDYTYEVIIFDPSVTK